MLRLLALALVAALAAAAPAAATTFTVTTTNDATDATIDGTCAIAGGGCSLRAALQEANATTGEDVISLPAGRYRITLAGTGEDAAATGDFDSTHTLTINGAGADQTVIDGNGADRVLEEIGGDLTLTGVTLTGGLIDDSGAAVNQSAGNLTIRDSAIVNNTADPANSQSGGGIDANGTSLLVERTLLAGNHAYNGGAIDGGATITIRASTIAHNTAGTSEDNGDGGALDTDAAIVDSTIVGNIAWNGGGSPGGIRGGSLRNTVVADNLSFDIANPNDPGVPDNCGSTITSQGNNVSSDATCLLTGPGDRENLDALLSDLADHGGPFASIVPLPGSPLIDTGAQCDALDMRGGGRPRGAACDVGAIETSLPEIAAASSATPVGQTAGFVAGAINPAFSPTTAHVEYGTTAAYGSATTGLAADGAFAALLTGLAPGTTYHARVVASNAYGTTAGPDLTFTTTATPAIDRKAPSLRKVAFAKKLRGKITFTLSERADVRFVFIGANGRSKATLKVRGKSGKNSAKLPSKLKAGRYAVVSWATDAAGNRSAPGLKTIRLRKR